MIKKGSLSFDHFPQQHIFPTWLTETLSRQRASVSNYESGSPHDHTALESNYKSNGLHTALEVNSDAATPIVVDIPSGISSGASTLEQEQMQTDGTMDQSRVAEGNQYQQQKSKCPLFFSRPRAVTQTK